MKDDQVYLEYIMECIEVEYGDMDDEKIGDGVIRCLSLVNNLEVNEQILYARMMNTEQSTLIE